MAWLSLSEVLSQYGVSKNSVSKACRAGRLRRTGRACSYRYWSDDAELCWGNRCRATATANTAPVQQGAEFALFSNALRGVVWAWCVAHNVQGDSQAGVLAAIPASEIWQQIQKSRR